MTYDGQLAYQQTPDEYDEVKWPTMVPVVARTKGSGWVAHLAFDLMNQTSEYKGNIVNLEFYCDPLLSGKGQIELVPYDPVTQHDGARFGDEFGSMVPAAPAFLGVECLELTSQVNITKRDVDSGELLPGACFELWDEAKAVFYSDVCDNDAQPAILPDEDPADGLIRVTVMPRVYSVEETKPPWAYNLDPANRLCDAPPGGKCQVTFYNELTTSQVNITNVGQYPLPKTCFEVRDELQNPVFVVCDNDFQGPPDEHGACIPDSVCEDEDPTEGRIRVTVFPGGYSVLEDKVPYNHIGDPSKQDCPAVACDKCETIFVNTPGNSPWFPWDIDGNGLVDLFTDIFGVANNFGATKP